MSPGYFIPSQIYLCVDGSFVFLSFMVLALKLGVTHARQAPARAASLTFLLKEVSQAPAS